MIKDVWKIDEQGFYVDLVKVDTEANTFYSDAFEWIDIGFEHVEVAPPVLCRPKWDGSGWIDGATPEEIQAWQEANRPSEQQLSETDMIMLALAELDTQRETDKLETQLAIAELTNTLLGGTANE